MQNPRMKGRPHGRRLKLDVAALNRLRADAGYSEHELARAARIGSQTLASALYWGSTSAYTVRQLATALGCPPAWLAPEPSCISCGRYLDEGFGPWTEIPVREEPAGE